MTAQVERYAQRTSGDVGRTVSTDLQAEDLELSVSTKQRSGGLREPQRSGTQPTTASSDSRDR